MTTAKNLAVHAAAFGTGGWILESTLFGARYSALFGGIKVPVLPVYAFGGLAIETLSKQKAVKDLPWYARAAVYGASLSAIELAGCWVDRDVLGACSWDYSKRGCRTPLRGCVDLKHAMLWGALGLAVEEAADSFGKVYEEVQARVQREKLR